MKLQNSFARSYLFLLLGAVIVLLGPVSMFVGVRWPLYRENYWISFVIAVMGGTICMIHAVSRRTLISFAAGILMDLAAVFFVVSGILIIESVPDSGKVPRSGNVPEVALHDSAGAKVVLSEMVQKNGKTILVFFRGVW
ncbi:MAG: hypothetical protein ACKVS6_02825 [Planctomycetota bacterium]